MKDASEAPLPDAAGYLIRHLASGRAMPEGAANVMELWRGFIEDQAGGTLEDLQDSLEDQGAFARLARQVISDLGYGDQLGEDPDSEDESDEEAEADDEQPEPDSTGQEDQDDSQSETDPDAQSQDQPDQVQVSADEMADEDMGEEVDMPDSDAPPEPPAPPEHVVPIYVGGHSDAAVRRAARVGDGWIGAQCSAEDLEGHIARLRAALEAEGRAGQPFEIKATPLVPATVDDMAKLAAAGLTDVMTVPWYFVPGDPDDPQHQLDSVAWFAEHVIHPLRDLEVAP